jgi:predicted ArsR family transcriptional regulator
MFEGIRRSYTLLALLLVEVIEELGTDRGLAMLQSSAERQADSIAREMGAMVSEDLGPIERGVLIYRKFMEDAGAEVTVHERGEGSVTFRVGRCPFYEALLDVGVDCDQFLGGLCKHLTLPTIRATLARFDQRLMLEPVLVRGSAEEFCLERMYLGQTRPA